MPDLSPLLARHADFRAYARARVGDAGDDLLQAAYERALQHAPDVSAERLEAWFFRVLRNAAIDHHRRARAEAHRRDAYVREASEDDAPEGTACGCAVALVPTLRPAYAETIARLDLRGESSEAVASALGVSRDTLKMRHHRARRQLRARVLERCGPCCASGCGDCTCGA